MEDRFTGSLYRVAMANKITLRPGQLYAVTKGTYFGSNLVCIKKVDDRYEFLELNDMKNISIEYNDIQSGIENNVLELLELIPADIMDVCTKQYEKNINSR